MAKVPYENLSEWEQNAVDRGVIKHPKKEAVVFDMDRDAAKLATFIDEAMIPKEQIELFKGSIKDIRDRAKEELGIKPSQFNKVLGMRFKRNRDEVETENEELIELYDNAFSKKQDQD